MNRGCYSHKFLAILGFVLMLATGAFLTGCGGDTPEVETEPTIDPGQTIEEDLPPVVEPEPEEPVVVTPDYAEMAPQDYGIEDIYFAFDKYDLDGEAMAILAANARILREVGVTLLISGHCDERGTVEYNLALGEKRAHAVRDYLVSLNVPSRMLRITSYGESKPFVYGHHEDAWAMNRRAHFERP